MTYKLPDHFIISDPQVFFRKLGRRLYQLEEDFRVQTDICPRCDINTKFISLTKHGVLIMRQGYVSDGSSGPTIQSRSSMRGAFVHDALYRLMRRGLLDLLWRQAADQEIRKFCIADRMWQWRAELWYKMLRRFGERNALPKNVCAVLVAP